MIVVRQAGVLLLAALLTSRGLFAQDSAAVATASPTDQVASPADQVKVLLRPTEIRYVHQESVLLPPTAKIKGLYVNAWAFGSPKLWQLVRLADETEINAFVVDVKDDTGCLLYPSTVPTAEQIGANRCVRAKDARARLDTLAKHGIYAIARIVVAKDPLLAERKSGWSVKERGTGQLWRDRINIAWVDAYNQSVWIYAAQRPAVPRRAPRPDRGAETLRTAPRLGRDPALPAGVHARAPAPPLHPLRDPRADPCGRRPGDHLVGAVESAECVPARLAATEAGRRVGGGTGPLQPRRPLIGPTVKPTVRRAPSRAATRRCSRRWPTRRRCRDWRGRVVRAPSDPGSCG